MLQAEVFEACLPVLRAFDDLGVEYLVGGSLASSFHGIPRSTQDVDVVAEVSDRQWQDLLGVLKVRGGEHERGYLERGAEALAVADLLTRALTDAGFA